MLAIKFNTVKLIPLLPFELITPETFIESLARAESLSDSIEVHPHEVCNLLINSVFDPLFLI